MSQPPSFGPSETARQLEVADRTLRYWSRYFREFLSPAASAGQTEKGHRHRRYTPQDIETLRTVRDLAARNVPLARVADVLSGRVDLEHVLATTPASSERAPTRRRGRQAAGGASASAGRTAAGAQVDRLQEQVERLQAQLREAEARLAQLQPSPSGAAGTGDPPGYAESASPGDVAPAGIRVTARDRDVVSRVIRLMVERGLTRRELAARAGVPFETLGAILSWRLALDAATASAIATALGTSVPELTEGERGSS